MLQASVVGATDRADQPPELREGGIFVLDMGEAVKSDAAAWQAARRAVARRLSRMAPWVPPANAFPSNESSKGPVDGRWPTCATRRRSYASYSPQPWTPPVAS